MKNFKLEAIIIVGVLFLLPVAMAQQATTEQPKTTPDKPFYGLSVALDNINLALTFEKNAKARKGLEIARERLLEVKAMQEAGKLDKAEVAANNYARTQDTIANSIDSIKGVISEKDADIEDSLTSLDEKTGEVSSELSADKEFNGLATEQKAQIDRINEKISAHKKAIASLEARKYLLKEISAERLREIEKKHEGRGLAGNETKAVEEIAKADAELMAAAQLVTSQLPQGEKFLANAKEHLTKAREALAAKKYGEAFGQANAAYHLAKALEKRVNKIQDKEQKKAEQVGEHEAKMAQRKTGAKENNISKESNKSEHVQSARNSGRGSGGY